MFNRDYGMKQNIPPDDCEVFKRELNYFLPQLERTVLKMLEKLPNEWSRHWQQCILATKIIAKTNLLSPPVGFDTDYLIKVDRLISMSEEDRVCNLAFLFGLKESREIFNYPIYIIFPVDFAEIQCNDLNCDKCTQPSRIKGGTKTKQKIMLRKRKHDDNEVIFVISVLFLVPYIINSYTCL